MAIMMPLLGEYLPNPEKKTDCKNKIFSRTMHLGELLVEKGGMKKS